MRQIVLRVRAVYQCYVEFNGHASAAAITLYGFLAWLWLLGRLVVFVTVIEALTAVARLEDTSGSGL